MSLYGFCVGDKLGYTTGTCDIIRYRHRMFTHGVAMNILKNLIERCYQRHEKPLKQRRTVVTSAPYKGLPYHFTTYCAHKYPVKLYELEASDISFMPIGLAPWNDEGPMDLGGERFLKRQGIEGLDNQTLAPIMGNSGIHGCSIRTRWRAMARP